jgi:non-heme chloroperoxidase
MSTVTTNDGVTIFYKDWGPKNAQPIGVSSRCP